jgi:hypothetical protein
MKNKFILVVVFFFSFIKLNAQTQNITFIVSNPDSTPVYVFGSWNGWSNWPGTPMASIGGGQYSATVSMNSNSTYEYLFVNGTAPFAKEALDPAWSCTNGNVQYTNRTLSVGSADATYCSVFDSCVTCTPVPPPANVVITFQVQSPDSLPVYIFGSWTNWSNYPGTLMTAIGNNTYEAQVTLPPNTPFEYLYVNGGGQYAKETLDPSWSCTNGNAQYTNRIYTTPANNAIECKIWDSCGACFTPPPATVAMKFTVENPDSTPVYVFGSWSNWNNFPGDLMTSIGGGKYSVTLNLLPNATYEYLFVNGSQKEVLNPAWSCTNGNGQYTNRVLNLGSTNDSTCRKWASCDSCGSVVPSNVNVKFQVQSPDSTPVYVFGSWSNWSNFPGTLMTAKPNNIYEAIIPMGSNQDIEYLFVNGVGTKEILDPTALCTNGNTQYTNRTARINGSDTSFCAVWSKCMNCIPLGLAQLSKENFSVYLSENSFKVNCDYSNIADGITITDIAGKLVFKSDGKISLNRFLNTNLIHNSVYFVNVTIDNRSVTLKGITQ